MLINITSFLMIVCVCDRCVCVCVLCVCLSCACVRFVCVLCACLRERERERESVCVCEHPSRYITDIKIQLISKCNGNDYVFQM